MTANVLARVHNFRGKARMASALGALWTTQDARLLIQRDGLRYEVGTSDLLERDLLFGLGSTKRVAEGLAKLAIGASVVWDVGANIGSIALRLAARLPHARVFAFEPSPPNVQKLLANVSLNPGCAERIQCFALAMSDRDGVVPFFASSEAHNSGVGGLSKAGNRRNQPVYLTACRADTLVRAGLVPPPDLVKIDVEGWEAEVLSGFGGLLEGPKAPSLLVENEPYRLKERGLPVDCVPAFLLRLGYELFFVEDGGELVRYDPKGLDRGRDLWATKSRGR